MAAAANLGSPPDAPARAGAYVHRMSSGQPNRRTDKQRYLVQRTFPQGLNIPVDNGGVEVCREVVERNAEEATPEAIRNTAALNQLPVDQTRG